MCRSRRCRTRVVGVPLDQYASRTRGHRHLAVPAALSHDSNYPHLDHTLVRRVTSPRSPVVQMARREFWNSLGHGRTPGLTMNDVTCAYAQSDTRYVIYTPDVQLIHHVSSSRGTLDPLEDRNPSSGLDISAPSRSVLPEACCYSARRCSTCALRSPVSIITLVA